MKYNNLSCKKTFFIVITTYSIKYRDFLVHDMHPTKKIQLQFNI